MIAINDVKKQLYIEKPIAKKIGKNTVKDAVYKTKLKSGRKVLFDIPQNEGSELKNTEPSQLLIRWIRNVN